MDDQTIKSEVRSHYAAIAQQGSCGCGPSCCSKTSEDVIRLVDTSLENQAVVPGSDLGLGCGFPTQSANLMAGEVVLDLGSGAGIDVFLSAKAVGSHGRVIGVDMTPEMIELARRNAAGSGIQNVEFRLGEIEALPVEKDSVDVVLSNCVINLVPDKRRAFQEIFRVLKDGGRISISDIVTFGVIPEQIRRDLRMWAECVSGALDQEEYLDIIRQTGFVDVKISQSTAFDDQQDADYGMVSITVQARKP